MNKLVSLTSHDYFDIEFNRLFLPTEDFFGPLFKILHIDSNAFDREKSYPGETIEKIENIMIFRYSQHIRFINDRVKETCRLELKGEGCREFEELGGDWIELFDYALLNASKFKRWDIFREIHTPSITREQYIEKIAAGEFTSRFRSINDEESFVLNDEEGFTKPQEYSIRDNSKTRASSKGFSITFGKKSSNGYQLQIYDKTAERYSKMYSYMADSAIRIEVRLFGPRINNYLIQAYQAMKNNILPSFVSSLILNFLNIKEFYSTTKHNYRRVHTWEPWLRELGLQKDSIEEIVNLPTAHPELSLERKFSWAYAMFSKTLYELKALMLRIGTPDLFEQFLDGCLKRGESMVDNALVARLNQAMKTLDLLDEDTKFNSIEELKDFVKPDLNDFLEFHPFIKHFIIDYKYDEKTKEETDEDLFKDF